ncbi:RNA polymerase sigma factor [Streptomyces chartreusis]
MDRNDAQPLSAASAERLDRLFRLYASRVLAYAVTRAKRPEDAHDIAGETWAKACRTITTLRADDDHAMPWLAGIVRHASVDYYRPKREDEEPRDWTDALASSALPSSPPADDALYLFTDLEVCEARALKLAAQGLGPSAIGARLGWHRSVVTRRLESGARRLRSPLALAG